MKKIFYYTFDGITDHLGQSQVLPYIFGCSDKNKYHLFSHEKNLKQAKQDTELQKQLAEHSVSWSATQFMYGKSIKKLLVTSLGILRMYKIILTFKPDILHGRGFIPSVILAVYSKISNTPFIYDFRSFSVEEWHEIGAYPRNSLLHKLLTRIDRWTLKSASCVVVLTYSAKEMLLETHDLQNIHVIPTSVQAIEPFQYRKNGEEPKKLFKFVYSGGAQYPYEFKLAIEFLHRLGLIFPIELTIYNKADVHLIESLLLDLSPSFSYKILNLPHQELLANLPNFDCAIFLIDVTPARLTCCPTKLGEFLSAGLPILANTGIGIVDDIQKKYGSILFIDHLIKSTDDIIEPSSKLNEVKDFISNSEAHFRSSKKAFNEVFEIKIAISSYSKVYQSISG